jgi:hypothetical protein
MFWREGYINAAVLWCFSIDKSVTTFVYSYVNEKVPVSFLMPMRKIPDLNNGKLVGK